MQKIKDLSFIRRCSKIRINVMGIDINDTVVYNTGTKILNRLNIPIIDTDLTDIVKLGKNYYILDGVGGIIGVIDIVEPKKVRIS